MSGKLIKDLTERMSLTNTDVMEIQTAGGTSTNKVKISTLSYYDTTAGTSNNLVYNTDGFKVWLDVVYSHVYSAMPPQRRALVTVTALIPAGVSSSVTITDPIIPLNLRPEATVYNRIYNDAESTSLTQLRVIHPGAIGGDTNYVSLHNDLSQSRMMSVTYALTVNL